MPFQVLYKITIFGTGFELMFSFIEQDVGIDNEILDINIEEDEDSDDGDQILWIPEKVRIILIEELIIEMIIQFELPRQNSNVLIYSVSILALWSHTNLGF